MSSRSFGRTPINNCDNGRRTIAYQYRNEQRIERLPTGRIARFVDPDGNVTAPQLSAEGDTDPVRSEHRARLTLHAQGFIEHGRCPVLRGMLKFPGKIGRDFAEMPEHLHESCAGDPRTLVRRDGEVHAVESCPHVEWLITYRRAKAAAAFAKVNAKALAAEKKLRDREEREALELEKLRAEVRGEKRKSKKED